MPWGAGYAVTGPADASATVLCFNPGGANLISWEIASELLAAAGVRLVLHDCRGLGFSDVPAAHDAKEDFDAQFLRAKRLEFELQCATGVLKGAGMDYTAWPEPTFEHLQEASVTRRLLVKQTLAIVNLCTAQEERFRFLSCALAWFDGTVSFGAGFAGPLREGGATDEVAKEEEADLTARCSAEVLAVVAAD